MISYLTLLEVSLFCRAYLCICICLFCIETAITNAISVKLLLCDPDLLVELSASLSLLTLMRQIGSADVPLDSPVLSHQDTSLLSVQHHLSIEMHFYIELTDR